MAKRDLIRNVILLLVGVVVLIALRIWVFDMYQIKSTQANHFLHEGDRILVQKNDIPKRGDFVLYQVKGVDYVGRVIAKAGDTAVYMDDVLYLNHQTMAENYLAKDKEKYLSSPQNTGYFTHDFTLASLPQAQSDKVASQHYLVLNDNRQDTQDSRQFGLISQKQIRGVLHFRLTPLEHFGFIETK